MSVTNLDVYDIVDQRHQLDQNGGGGSYITNTFRVGNIAIQHMSSINLVDKNYTFEYNDYIRTAEIIVNDGSFGTIVMFHSIPKGGGDIEADIVTSGELDRGPTTVYLNGGTMYINGQDTGGNYYISISLDSLSVIGSGSGHITTGTLLDNTAISDGGFSISGDSTTYVSTNDSTVPFMKFTQ